MINGLTSLVEQFSLPELTRVLRRTMVAAVVVAVLTVVVSAFLNAVTFGFGVVIGLGLGIANIRLVTAQTTRVSEQKPKKPMRALASLTLTRLAVTTAIVVVLAVITTSLGLGAVAGIAVFYMIFLVTLIGGIVRHKGVPT